MKKKHYTIEEVLHDMELEQQELTSRILTVVNTDKLVINSKNIDSWLSKQDYE